MIHLSVAASETQEEKNLEIPHPNAMSHGLRVMDYESKPMTHRPRLKAYQIKSTPVG